MVEVSADQGPPVNSVQLSFRTPPSRSATLDNPTLVTEPTNVTAPLHLTPDILDLYSTALKLADGGLKHSSEVAGRRDYDPEIGTKFVDAIHALPQRDQLAHAAELSRLLSEYSGALYKAGLFLNSGEVDAQAVAMTRHLYRTNPDKYAENLADRLAEYGIILHSSGLYAQACKAKTEAVELVRRLYEQNPIRYASRLASLLDDLGRSLACTQSYEKACEHREECVRIGRQLHEGDPNNPQHASSFCLYLNDYAFALLLSGAYQKANDVSAECISLSRQLQHMTPNSEQWAQNFVCYLDTHAVALSFVGSHIEAYKVESELFEMLGRVQHGNSDQSQQDMLPILFNRFIVLGRLGDAKGAQGVWEKALTIKSHLHSTEVEQRNIALARELKFNARFLRLAQLDVEAAELEAEVAELEKLAPSSPVMSPSEIVHAWSDLVRTRYPLSHPPRVQSLLDVISRIDTVCARLIREKGDESDIPGWGVYESLSLRFGVSRSMNAIVQVGTL